MSSYRWFVDGTLHEVNGLPFALSNLSLRGLAAGDYNVEVVGTTVYGNESREEIVISVAENQTPTCTFDLSQDTMAYVVTAKCLDPDGYATKFFWNVNGVEEDSYSRRYTIKKATYTTGPIVVSVIATDDSNEQSVPFRLQVR